jgi:hypothetical protein
MYTTLELELMISLPQLLIDMEIIIDVYVYMD